MRLASADVNHVAHVLAAEYGLVDATTSELPGEEDGNLAVQVAGGARYVLKIAAPDVSLETVLFQCRLLARVRASDVGIEVPEIVPTLAGEVVSQIQVGESLRPARLLTWLSGTTLAALPRRSPDLLADIGRAAAELTVALASGSDPAANRTHHWDLRGAAKSVAEMRSSIEGDEHRASLEEVLGWVHARVDGRLDALPSGVVHHDLNDHNLLAARTGPAGAWRLCGVLDFGDALHTARVADLAVAVAYAMLRQPHPLAAAQRVVSGYHSVLPLQEDELAVVFPLAALRLCLNAATWEIRRSADPSHAYAYDRMRYTWPTLARLRRYGPDVAEAMLRAGCGLHPDPGLADFLVAVEKLDRHSLVADLAASGSHRLDLSPRGDGPDLRVPPPTVAGPVWMSRHGEARWSEHGPRASGDDEPATIGLGLNVVLSAGTMVACPLPGVVETVDPVNGVVIRHETGHGKPFWSRFGNVVAEPWQVGESISAGDPLGRVSPSGPHDSLPSNVFVQLARWMPPDLGAWPRFAVPSEQQGWLAMFPDPAPGLLGLAVDSSSGEDIDASAVRDLRTRHVARSQRAYYAEPMELVRAYASWFTDADGYDYLDAINNVSHVGHGHPRVVAALSRQSRRLNTNSRFLYRELGQYADRLSELLPDPLDVVFFACSGSEANDLALRIARTVTGRTDVAVIAGAYHGNTTAVTAISPNRYRGPGGTGRPDTTHELVQPDRYRGAYGYDDPLAGEAYGADAAATIATMARDGRPAAAVFAESLMGTAGQIVHPPGYLSAVFAAARAGGALCVSDEVQVGFGRLGHEFWGFQRHDVVPDIVTMGKPMGNGHPMAAVVTTRAIADAFDTGMKYFNTFGGNPVSCAVGTAVLDVIRDEDLQEHALVVGGRLRHRLTELADRHEVIGDVRGEGLYIGVDLVQDRQTKMPARDLAYALCERMKEEGVIVYPNGDLDNVLKIKPPMVITESEADFFVDTFDRVLTDW